MHVFDHTCVCVCVCVNQLLTVISDSCSEHVCCKLWSCDSRSTLRSSSAFPSSAASCKSTQQNKNNHQLYMCWQEFFYLMEILKQTTITVLITYNGKKTFQKQLGIKAYYEMFSWPLRKYRNEHNCGCVSLSTRSQESHVQSSPKLSCILTVATACTTLMALCRSGSKGGSGGTASPVRGLASYPPPKWQYWWV